MLNTINNDNPLVMILRGEGEVEELHSKYPFVKITAFSWMLLNIVTPVSYEQNHA